MIPAGCSRTLHGENGTVVSPLYPTDYPANEFCDWIIAAPSGHRLRLEFEVFDVETSPNCTKDFLKVFFQISFNDFDFLDF